MCSGKYRSVCVFVFVLHSWLTISNAASFTRPHEMHVYRLCECIASYLPKIPQNGGSNSFHITMIVYL